MSTENLRSALVAAQATVNGMVFKAGANTAQNYRYVGHKEVIEHVREAMRSHGIVVVPTRLRFVQDLTYRTSRGEQHAWLWEQDFVVVHVASNEREAVTVQATTACNDKAAFVASTAADRTLLMRLMRLAGTSEENPEHDSHDEQQPNGQRQGGGQQRPAQGKPAQQQQRQPSADSGRVIQGLLEDLAKLRKSDRSTLASFYAYAREQLEVCAASEQQRTTVQKAFGQVCESNGLKPRDVISGRAA